MIEEKSFFLSKINWVGILLILASLADLSVGLPEDAQKWILFASGVATLILRTFFTDTRIK